MGIDIVIGIVQRAPDGMRVRTGSGAGHRASGERGRPTGTPGPSVLALALVLSQALAAPAPAGAQDVRALLEAPIEVRAAARCPPVDAYSAQRPDPPGTPTLVGVGIAFNDISHFDDITQTLTADVYVVTRWLDPRLAESARSGSADCAVPGDELWKPVIEPENLRSRSAFYDPRFLVDAAGVVTLARRQLVEVSYPLDLHDFPFDAHDFRITLWPVLAQADEVTFHPLNRAGTAQIEWSIQGWAVGDRVASVGVAARPTRNGRFARFDIIVPLTRNWSYFAWKLGVPLAVIVLMAYAVYWLPKEYVAQQVGVGMTSVLTLVAYMLALGSTLPRIAYLTTADRVFVGCAVLVFLGLIKAIVTAVWVRQDASERIRRADLVGRWAYPIAVLLVLVLALRH